MQDNMLQTAVKAGLPLIVAYTDDEVNASAVIARLTNRKVFQIEGYLSPAKVFSKLQGVPLGMASQQALFVTMSPQFIDSSTVNSFYKRLVEAGLTLLVVNPQKTYRAMFDVGLITPPQKMVMAVLKEFVETDRAVELLASLQNVSLKDVTEICLLASARYGEISRETVLEARRMCLGSLTGLEQVSAETEVYIEDPTLLAYLTKNLPFMLKDDVPQPLRPRGLLMEGPPGTGKTLAAKVIAQKTGFPLYRLSLGGVLNKYIGESESNMEDAMRSISQAAPCVFLIDEVEKLFNATSDGGTTSRLLSMLLWWLQEHREMVFTVMTTNNREALPEELYRPGRVDQIIWLGGFDFKQACAYLAEFLNEFGQTQQAEEIAWGLAEEHKKAEMERYNPAALREIAVNYLKDTL